MNLFNFGNKKRKNLENALVYRPEAEKLGTINYISEALKGLVLNKKTRFPSELGEEHPFDYETTEGVCKRFGAVGSIVDKHIDFMMSGGIKISCENGNEKAIKIIEDFMRDNQFDSLMRKWFREAFIKGTGFMELGGGKNDPIEGIKVLDSKYMYVKRDAKGKVEGYTQFTKPLKELSNNDAKDIESFKTTEIAQLNFNMYGDCAYGLGIIYQAMMIIDDLIGSRKELHTLMKRKANNPFFFIMGDKAKGEYPEPGEMDDLGSRLEYLNNKHEWTLSAFVEPKVLDTGDIGSKFEFVINNDLETLFMATQTPALLMGKTNTAEGKGGHQMRAWELRIASLREEAEKVIEEKIFKRVLSSNGIEDVHIEIEWGLPNQEEKNETIKILIEAIKNPFLNDGLRLAIQDKLATIMDIDMDEVETETEDPIPNPVVKKPIDKKPMPEGEVEGEESYITESIGAESQDDMSLKEWVGFNYVKYKDDVLIETEKYDFPDLKGKTKMQIDAGLLTSDEIEKLRLTMYESFDNELSIRDIEKRLDKRIKFKDRYVLKDGAAILKDGKKVLAMHAALRPLSIARTETIRLSNRGAVKNYKDSGIKKMRWLATPGERTCEACNDLNGTILPVDANVAPPLHPLCRCTVTPVVEK